VRRRGPRVGARWMRQRPAMRAEGLLGAFVRRAWSNAAGFALIGLALDAFVWREPWAAPSPGRRLFVAAGWGLLMATLLMVGRRFGRRFRGYP